ncbi:MAG TPA: hypothetical protein VFB06_13250 [Streptosporangiaceae bacterium]|nr:hypothetical protein [Streptosporangiaceae bacterium]
MIKIRYSSELQPGLNGHAERLDRTTVVYLQPGLTPAERTATLRRLHQHGRMGRGPALPRWQLGLALLADRVRMAFGQAGAIVRTHPAGSTLPVMAVSAAVAGFLVLSAVSIRIVHTPLAAPPVASAAAGEPGAQGPNPQIPGAQARHQNGTSQPGGVPVSSRAPAASGTGSGPGAPTPAPGSTSTPTRSGSTPPPSSLQSPVPTPATSSASPGPSAAASPASSTTRVCVSIGPFGVCLGL